MINNSYSVLTDNLQIHINSLKILENNKNAHYFFTSTSEVYAGSLENKLLKFPTKEDNILALQDLNNRDLHICFPKYIVKHYVII